MFGEIEWKYQNDSSFKSSFYIHFVVSDCTMLALAKALALSRFVFTSILWPRQSFSSSKHLVRQHCLHNWDSHFVPQGFGQVKHSLQFSRVCGNFFEGFLSNFFIFLFESPSPSCLGGWGLFFNSSSFFKCSSGGGRT